MPISLTSNPLGRFQSRVNAQRITAGAASLETIVVNHGLGRTPDKVRAILRCIRAAISGAPNMVYLSANASIATLQAGIENGAVDADWDFDCEVVHTTVR